MKRTIIILPSERLIAELYYKHLTLETVWATLSFETLTGIPVDEYHALITGQESSPYHFIFRDTHLYGPAIITSSTSCGDIAPATLSLPSVKLDVRWQ